MVQHLLSGRDAIGSSPYETVLEQLDCWASANSASPRGELVWTPTAPNSNKWHCWRTWRNNRYSTDGIDCRELYGSHVFKCFEGTRFGIDFGSYGYPVSGWGTNSYIGYATIYSSTKPLTLDIPAGTKRLYVLILRQTNDSYCTFSLSQGSGSLDYTRFNIGSANTGGSDIPGYGYNFESWVRIATDCGGQTITLTPDGSNNTHLLGFIAVSDVPSNPYDGVFDPGTRIDITPLNQCAPHPIRFKTAAIESDWWGLGHTSQRNTLTAGYVENMQYAVGGDTGTWNPTARTNYKIPCTQFRVSLSGIATVDIASTAVSVGQYAHAYNWTAAGMDIAHRYAFDTGASNAGLQLPSDLECGYSSQWGLEAIFDYCRSIPNIGRNVIEPYNQRRVGESYSGTMLMESNEFTAMFTGQQFAMLSGGAWFPKGSLEVIPRSTDSIPKFYQGWYSGDTAVDIAAGDVLFATSRRTLAASEAL